MQTMKEEMEISFLMLDLSLLTKTTPSILLFPSGDIRSQIADERTDALL